MIDILRHEIEDAAFLVASEGPKKEIHSKLLRCLIMLDKLSENPNLADSAQPYDEEVNKVQRRLKMWAQPNKQNQYNAKILNAFLELKQAGKAKITESDIESHIGRNTWFAQNFPQMKIAADRNHGKIFEVNESIVEIWPPVLPAVQEYENTIMSRI